MFHKTHCRLFIVVTFTVLLFYNCGWIAATPPRKPISKESLEEIFQKGFAHREQIKSGQMEISNSLERMNGGQVVSKVRREIKIVFDEKRRRVDRHNVFSPNSYYDDVGCIGCYNKNDELVLQYGNQVAPKNAGNETTLCTFFDKKQLEENQLTKIWTDDYGFVPQYIAMFNLARLPTPEYVEKSKKLLFSNTLDIFEHSDITAEEEDYKGVSCTKISFKNSWEHLSMTSETSLWISESQGCSIRKFYQKVEGGPIPLVELLEVDVEQDKDSGIWFPSSWHFERERDGKLHTRQNGTIKNVVLNQPIPEDVFDMKKIDILPKGVMVLWQAKEVPPPHEGRLIWDGNDIVSGETRGEHLNVIPPRGSRVRKMLLINGAILCFIAAAVSYRSYRRQRQFRAAAKG